MTTPIFCRWPDRPDSPDDGDYAIYSPDLNSRERFHGTALLEYLGSRSSWVVLSTFGARLTVPIIYDGSLNTEFWTEVTTGNVTTSITADDEYRVTLGSDGVDPRFDLRADLRVIPAGKAGMVFYGGGFNDAVNSNQYIALFVGKTLDADESRYTARSGNFSGVLHEGADTFQPHMQAFDDSGNDTAKDYSKNGSSTALQTAETGFVRATRNSGTVTAAGGYEQGFEQVSFSSPMESMLVALHFSNTGDPGDGNSTTATVQGVWIEV